METLPPVAAIKKRLLVQIVDDLATEKSERIYSEYPISPTTYEDGFRKITFPMFANAINGVAWWLHNTIGPGKNFETLAYIGTLDLRYNALILGAVKTGYKVLLASPRNSIPAHVNLFNLLDCKIMVTPNPRPQAVTAITSSHNIRVLEIPTLEELLSTEYPHYPYEKTFEDAQKEPLVVLHTSGTTGFPKPIIWTHEFAASWLEWFRMEAPPGHINTHTMWSPGRLFFTFPPFHAAAMFGSILSAIYNQTTIIYPLSGVIPSAQIIVDGLKHTKAGCAAIAPLFVEEISKKPELLEFLSENLTSIFYSGGNVASTIGDKIAQRMKFYSIMGTTECGLFPTLNPAETWPKGDWEDWNYFRFNPGAMIELQQLSGDEYEAVVVRHPDLEKEQPVFKIFPERKEYHTGDLYTPHPSKPDLWLYRGRSDDIIVFLTGEKTNPISMEESIARHPEIRAVLVTGTLRFQAALLVELVTEEKLSVSEKAQVIERLWPIIQEANADCPRHAQIKKSHILFTDSEKPMMRAGKGTIQRRPTLGLYAKEIDELYADADKASASVAEDANTTGLSINIKDSEAISSFISESVARYMDATAIGNEDNFFISGMDSLQALQLTRRLKCVLAVPDLEVSTVYANPSISLLTKAIVELSNEHETSAVLKQTSRIGEMEKTLEKYKILIGEIARSQKAEPLTNGVAKDRIVLLTGSTGAIGGYMLQNLLDTPDVSHIYCLNRASDSHSLQVTRNKARGLPSEYTPNRVSFLTADIAKESLGLEVDVYEKLSSSVTDIIHNAWPVNFNMSLSTFEPHLTGVVNLLKLAALTSHTTSFLFISSISSVLASTVSPIPETIITDPLAALPMGYGESKYLAERILDHASSTLASLNISIARVGQVAGPAYSPGFWNKWEWFPSLVTSSLYLGIVPDSLGKGADVIDWVPIDFLADALVELALGNTRERNGSGAKVFHPLNPCPTSWQALKPVVGDVLNGISSSRVQGRTITEVPLSTWVERVRVEAEKLDGAAGLAEMLEVNPAIKLLGFYEGLLAGDGLREVDGKRAMEGSEKLRGLNGLKSEWMEKWITGWVNT